MPRRVLRELPQVQEGPWPLLLVTEADRHPSIAENEKERQRRIQRSSNDLLVRDIAAAALKGVLFGILFFSVFFGILLMGSFWLSSWHWIWLVGGAVLLSLLIGTGRTLLIIAFGLVCLSVLSMVVHWVYLLLLVSGSVLLRCSVELLPLKKQ